MITAAVQRTKTSVYVYNEKGNVIFVRDGTLQSYTNHNVIIRRPGAQHLLTVYNEKGNVERIIQA